MKSDLSHLARRAATSFNNSPVSDTDLSRARSILWPDEFALWSMMDHRDQRHSLAVLDRFVGLVPSSSRAARAAALLHDVGKTRSRLGWGMRIVATLIGPVGRRFSDYHAHEEIGGEMLSGMSDPETVSLVDGSATGPIADAMRQADNI